MSELSHLDETGAVRMVDVGGKPAQRRQEPGIVPLKPVNHHARPLR